MRSPVLAAVDPVACKQFATSMILSICQGKLFMVVFSFVVLDCPFPSASRAGPSRAVRLFAPFISPLTDRVRCYSDRASKHDHSQVGTDCFCFCLLGGLAWPGGTEDSAFFALAGAAWPRQQAGGHRIKATLPRFLRQALQRVVCAARPFTHNADYAAKRTVGWRRCPRRLRACADRQWRIIPRYVTWPPKAPFQGDGGLDKTMKALFALMGLAM